MSLDCELWREARCCVPVCVSLGRQEGASLDLNGACSVGSTPPEPVSMLSIQLRGCGPEGARGQAGKQVVAVYIFFLRKPFFFFS